jgi:orotidine-5'-phosphate decarboxylase
MDTRLIIALDFDSQPVAMELVDQLDPNQCALKVGSEMFTRFGPHFVWQLVDRKFKVFLDLKFHDIPNTVAQSCKAAADMGVWMVNVRAAGGFGMMQTARQALAAYGDSRPLLIAVTVLTSMSQTEFAAMGVTGELTERVKQLARMAQEAGLDGVVSSALEVEAIKSVCGPDFLTITPGIRLATDNQNDQSRVCTPQQALTAGSDFLVIGRPITTARDPASVVRDLLSLMKS